MFPMFLNNVKHVLVRMSCATFLADPDADPQGFYGEKS